jgi:hypothetical protein
MHERSTEGAIDEIERRRHDAAMMRLLGAAGKSRHENTDFIDECETAEYLRIIQTKLHDRW